jgi:flagellar biosynthesis/type III secretory pathway protein FliH
MFMSELRLVAVTGTPRVRFQDIAGSALPDPPDPEATRARDQAYAQGREDCERELRPELERLEAENIRLASRVPELITASFRTLEKEWCAEVCDLALHLLRILVRAEPERGEIVRGALKEALAEIPVGAGLRVRVHPDDAVLVQAFDRPLGLEMTVVPDPGLTRGDVMVEAPQGRIDARLDHRLQTCTAALTEALERLDHGSRFPEE